MMQSLTNQSTCIFFCHFFTTKSPKNCNEIMLQSLLFSYDQIKLTDSPLKRAWVLGDCVTSCQEPRNLCDVNFCFGKGDIYLFLLYMPGRCVVSGCSKTDMKHCCGRVDNTINTILATKVSFQSSITRTL